MQIPVPTDNPVEELIELLRQYYDQSSGPDEPEVAPPPSGEPRAAKRKNGGTESS